MSNCPKDRSCVCVRTVLGKISVVGSLMDCFVYQTIMLRCHPQFKAENITTLYSRLCKENFLGKHLDIVFKITLRTQRNEPYASVVNYIRTRLRFCLLKSVLTSLRGSRGRSRGEAITPISELSFNLINFDE